MSLTFNGIQMVSDDISAAPSDSIDGYQELREDWTVTGYENYSNEIIALFGDLTIQNGGHLILKNCTLLMMSSYLQPYSITIENKGTLEIYDCYVSDTPNDNDDILSAWYYFAAQAGSTLIIENSTIRQCGFLDVQNIERLGVYVGTNHGHISNTTINTSMMGLTLSGNNTGFHVENINITDIGMTGIYMINSVGVVINNASFTNISENRVMDVQISSGFTIENVSLPWNQYLGIWFSTGFSIKNIIGNETERVIRIEDSSYFTVEDVQIYGIDNWNSEIELSRCSNIEIDNVTVSDGNGIFYIDQTSYANITNINGYNVSRIIDLYNSKYIEISKLSNDIAYESIISQNSDQIIFDNITISNSTFPFRFLTVTNSSLMNITIMNPTSNGIDLRSESNNITISKVYIETNLMDFTIGLYIESSEVFVSDYNSNNINWSIHGIESDVYGEKINIGGSYEGERGIVIERANNVHLSDVTIQNQQWDGIRIVNCKTDNIRMDNVYINNTSTGVAIEGSNITFSELVIDNTFVNLSASQNSIVTIMNSTIGRMDIINSDIICINTTNTTGAWFAGASRLIRKWWVDVFVKDTVGPIAGATVKIYNGTGVLEVISTTGTDGFARNIPVTDIVYTQFGADSKNPHNTSAVGPGWYASNATTYQVKSNLWVNVTYDKNAPPHPPMNLHVISDQDSNTVLTWDPSISQDVNKYSIYIAKSLSSLNSLLASGIPNVTVLLNSYTHKGGSEDWQKYWYAVKANDSENESVEHALAACGNWVVNKTTPQFVNGADIILKGSLFVFGNLELKDTILKMDSSLDTIFGININNSASFKGENITIKRNDIRAYYFNIKPDAYVFINDSVINRPGVDNPGSNIFMEGIRSLTRNLTITNTNIIVEYCGLRIYSTSNFLGWIYNVSFQSNLIAQPEYLLNISDSSGVNITRCNLTADARYGIYAQSSSYLNISHSYIDIQGFTERSRKGIFIFDCMHSQIFSNNMIYGSPAIYIYQSTNISVISSYISSHESIGIYGDSSLYTTVKNCDFSREVGRPTTSIFMSWCRYSKIMDMDVNDQNWFLEMENESKSVIKNIRIENGDMGIFLSDCDNIFVNDTSIYFIYRGMAIFGSRDIYLFNTIINLTFYCLTIKSPGPIRLINCSVENGIGNEIIAEGYRGDLGSIFLINSTISSLSDSSLALNNSAAVFLINSSFNFSYLVIDDSASRVEVYYYLSIQVYDINNNKPPWANITISNVKDHIIYSAQAINGLAKWISIHQRTIFKDDEYVDNPHRINVFDGSHAGNLIVDINESQHLDVNVTNILPWAKFVTIYGFYDMPTPQADIITDEPTTKFNIVLSYEYQDIENDLESNTVIHWYVNGVRNSTLDGMKNISNKYTSKYQTWQAIVYPSDGYDSSYPAYPFESNVIFIANTAPNVTNITISPSAPTTSDDLSVQYKIYDIDGDGLDSAKTTHKWYYYNEISDDWVYSNIDSINLPNTFTLKGQRWRCDVTPNDGDVEGATISSQELLIGNTPPSVSNITITPANPRSNQTIHVSYEYSDLDSDVEEGSIIRWFRNDEEQEDLLGQRSIDPSRTNKGEEWQYIVTPSDGEDFGIDKVSELFRIGNTPPIASNITLHPENPTTSDDLFVEYEFFDNDGDGEGDETNIKWLRWNGIAFIDTGYRGKVLPSEFTSKNEIWTCEVTPHDKFNHGQIIKTNESVTIINSKPMVSEVILGPDKITTVTELVGSYKYSDLDNDIEMGSEIVWYRNEIAMPELNNKLIISHNFTKKGQAWFFTVRPKDGEKFGNLVKSNNITIQNSVPAAYNLTILPRFPLGDDNLMASYDYDDEDGDNESLPIIRWFKNGVPQKLYDDQLIVESDATKKDELWFYTINVFDGTDYSEELRSNYATIENSKAIINTITPAADKVALNESESMEFHVNAEDPDGDYLLYKWRFDKTPVGEGDFYEFTTTYESAGVYNLTLTIQDVGEKSFTLSYFWEITVQNVNRPPQLDSFDPPINVKMNEKTFKKFSISASDPDKEDILYYTWYFDGSELPGENSYSYTYSADEFAAGNHVVKVLIKDLYNESVEHNWNVTVVAVAEEFEGMFGLNWDQLGLLVEAIVVIFTAIFAAIGIIKLRKKRSKLKEYMDQIDEIFEKDESVKDKEKELIDLKRQIKDEFSQGLITENHYMILEREADDALGETRKAIIEERVMMPEALKEDVSEVLKDGMVTKEEYQAIMQKIRMTKELSQNEKLKMNMLMSQWMRESKGSSPSRGMDEKFRTPRRSIEKPVRKESDLYNRALDEPETDDTKLDESDALDNEDT